MQDRNNNEYFFGYIGKLSSDAAASVQHAEQLSKLSGSSYIGTEHLLLGVLANPNSIGAKLLSQAGASFDRTENTLALTPGSLRIDSGLRGFSETAKLSLRAAAELSMQFNQKYIGTEHLLCSIISQRNSRAIVLLKDMNIDIDELKASLEEFFDKKSEVDNEEQRLIEKMRATKSKSAESTGALSGFGVDLVEKAKAGKLDAMIGREPQVERIITILARRTKNNPVLVGEPGVGKTAVIEGLAQRIAQKKVPKSLFDKTIFQLDLTSIIAGTKYRGEFEDRLKKIVEEVKKREDIILFIDELHTLMGAGSAEGSLDAANILKPSLARGELNLIGATTFDEFRKTIQKDSALERRTQTVIIPEPTKKETTEILKGLRHAYESHHDVVMSDEVLESAVSLSGRYIFERFMPDKAIDVIDEAAALAKVKHGHESSPTNKINTKISQLSKKIEAAVAKEDFKEAAEHKTQLEKLKKQLAKLKKKNLKTKKIELTEQDIARAVAQISGLPVGKIDKSEAKLLKNLEKNLAKHIIGQSEAVKEVARAIRRSRSGLSSTNRPVGSFVFMGPTGVGKTELAKVVANEIFGSKDALIKVDMSEFAEKHNASRLLGAPAGYIGYEDGGQLTEKIRRRPYSVVLLDEFEKAHPDTLNILLQILEDGVISDAKGRQVDFSNTVIILTSNLGSEDMQKEASLGFSLSSASSRKQLKAQHDKNRKAASESLEKFMRPELINRFDKVIVFSALTKKEIGKIFDLLIKELQDRLDNLKIKLEVKPSLKRLIIKKGYDEFNGARLLRRALSSELEDLIAEGIVSGEFQANMTLEALGQKTKGIVRAKTT